MKENEDVKKFDVIDEDTKSLLGELLSVTRDIKKAVLSEIRHQKQIVENFNLNKDEYIENIQALNDFDKEFNERQKKIRLQELNYLKEKLKKNG